MYRCAICLLASFLHIADKVAPAPVVSAPANSQGRLSLMEANIEMVPAKYQQLWGTFKEIFGGRVCGLSVPPNAAADVEAALKREKVNNVTWLLLCAVVADDVAVVLFVLVVNVTVVLFAVVVFCLLSRQYGSIIVDDVENVMSVLFCYVFVCRAVST